MADKKEDAEAMKNCIECKKSISRAKRYYRNGSFYCNKNCYKKKMAKEQAAAEPEPEKVAKGGE